MADLVRRDCNYYNVDKIKTECTWDQDRQVWNLPKVITTKTTFAPVTSNPAIQKKSSSNLVSSTSSSLGLEMTGSSPLMSPRVSRHHAPIEETEGEKWTGGGREELEYFRPKRALELLVEGAQMRGSDPQKWSSLTQPTTGTANAAAVHGLKTLLAADTNLSRRRGRLPLQSLPGNPTLPPPPPPHSSVVEQLQPAQTQQDVLEVVEKVEKRNKLGSLEPLGARDIFRKPPPPL